MKKSSDAFTSISDNASVLQQENKMEEEDRNITMQLYHLMLAEEENEASSTSFNQNNNNNNVFKMRAYKDDTNDGDNKFSNVMESILLEDIIKLQNKDDYDNSDDEWTTIDDENNSFVGVYCKDKVVETVQQGISTNSKSVDEWSVISNVPSVYSDVSVLPTSSSIISMNSDIFTFTYSDALRFGHQQKNNDDEKINPLPEEEEEEDHKTALRCGNKLERLTSSNKKCVRNNANNNDYDDYYDADFIRDGVKYGHGGGVKFLSSKKMQKKDTKREQAY